jgi:hypothetical protein
MSVAMNPPRPGLYVPGRAPLDTDICLDDIRTARDMDMALKIAGVLSEHYPGHKFAVRVNSHPSVGMAYIQHWQLSENDGYRLKIVDLHGWPAIRSAAIKAGGEILERFQVRRGKADMDQLRTLELKSRFR